MCQSSCTSWHSTCSQKEATRLLAESKDLQKELDLWTGTDTELYQYPCTVGLPSKQSTSLDSLVLFSSSCTATWTSGTRSIIIIYCQESWCWGSLGAQCHYSVACCDPNEAHSAWWHLSMDVLLLDGGGYSAMVKFCLLFSFKWHLLCRNFTCWRPFTVSGCLCMQAGVISPLNAIKNCQCVKWWSLPWATCRCLDIILHNSLVKQSSSFESKF